MACWLAASLAESLWGWTMWNRDTRLTASWSLETQTQTHWRFRSEPDAQCLCGVQWCNLSQLTVTLKESHYSLIFQANDQLSKHFLIPVLNIHACSNHTNSQLSLHHVHYKAIHSASIDQVPGHASKVSGGVQQLIFPVLVHIFIGGYMYLNMRHKRRRTFNQDFNVILQILSTALFTAKSQTIFTYSPFILHSYQVALRKWPEKISWFMQSTVFSASGDQVRKTTSSMSSYPDEFWRVWFKLDQTQV